MAPPEGLYVMSIGEDVHRSTRINPAYANTINIRPLLQSAVTIRPISAPSDAGPAALKRTSSRSADEGEPHTDGEGAKTMVSFSQGDPENPYNWSTVCL